MSKLNLGEVAFEEAEVVVGISTEELPILNLDELDLEGDLAIVFSSTLNNGEEG